MKKKTCWSVYLALLFLIFLVVLFPYKESFDYNKINPLKNNDVSDSVVSGSVVSGSDVSGSDVSGLLMSDSNVGEPQSYSF